MTLWWLLAAALADEPVLDVFERWADKAAAELTLDGARPSRVIIGAQQRYRYSVSAEFGSLFSESEERARPGVVEVVVGDLQLDSSRFSSRAQTPNGARAQPAFVVEDVPIALERDLWITTDRSFKDAVVRYQQKRAALAQLPSAYPPDWSPVAPVTAVERATWTPVDRQALRELAAAVSGVYRDVPGVRSGWVEVVVEQAESALVTTEGVRVVQPEERAVVYTWCEALRPDGVTVYEEAQVLVERPDQLPSVAQLVADARGLADRVIARSKAPIVDFYEGPVVFEDRAAAQLFAYLMASELEGTPPEPRAGATWEQITRGGPRVGRRLLPAGWSAWDDPAAMPEDAPGGFTYDREGVAAQRVELVRDGYVVDLVMSRVPRPGQPQSNGHARGAFQGTWEGRLSAWHVEPAKGLRERAFDRQIEQARRAAGVEAVLVIRSLQRGRPGSLPRPLDAVWRYADGREVPVASLQFQNTNRRTLKDILAVAADHVVWRYLAGNSRGGTDGTTGGLPTVLTAPAGVLVDDMELAFPGSDRNIDAYPMPPL